jgi:hypothetical protein
MKTAPPAETIIEEAVERTGFKQSVIELLYQDYLEEESDESFFEFLGELLADASFVIAASKGFGVDGCLAAYDYGFQTVTDGIKLDDLEGVIDDIELASLEITEEA